MHNMEPIRRPMPATELRRGRVNPGHSRTYSVRRSDCSLQLFPPSYPSGLLISNVDGSCQRPTIMSLHLNGIALITGAGNLQLRHPLLTF